MHIQASLSVLDEQNEKALVSINLKESALTLYYKNVHILKKYLQQYGYVIDDKIQLENTLFPASLTDPKAKVKKALRYFNKV